MGIQYFGKFIQLYIFQFIGHVHKLVKPHILIRIFIHLQNWTPI